MFSLEKITRSRFFPMPRILILSEQRLLLKYSNEVIFLILICSFSFLGCTSSNKMGTLKLAYISKVKNDSFHENLTKGVKEQAIHDNVVVDVFYADNQQDVETQIRVLHEVIKNKAYQGVLIAPNDSEKLIPYMKELDDSGVRFILLDTDLNPNAVFKAFINNCGFVGTDNVHAGRLAAEFISGSIKSGNVVLMRGNHAHGSSIDREDGFLKGMPKTGLKVIARLSGLWEEKEAFDAFSKFKKASKDRVDAVYAYSDPMAIGVSRFYDENLKLKRPIIVGTDGVLVGQKAVFNGKIAATVVQSPEIMGKLGVEKIIECIRQKDAKKQTFLTPVTLLKKTMSLGTESETSYE